MAAFPFLDAPLPLAFAHRGGAADGVENTMTAFARAVAAGYRYVETDVHATADGVLVAFHDPTLDRVTDRTGRIAESTWDQVRAARVGVDERVPLFAELMDAWPDLRVNIDVKADNAVGPLVEVVRRMKLVDRVCVGSFSDRRLARVRAALGPGLATSCGPREVLGLRLSSWWGGGAAGGPRGVPCVQVPVRAGVTVVDPRFVDHVHRLGMQVHVWTIDAPADIHRLLDLGIDGIMTDRLDVLREVYTARGVWAG